MRARRILWALNVAAIACGAAALLTVRRHPGASEAALTVAVFLVILASIALTRKAER